MAKEYDFAGWATKNDIKCSDGRTIRENAFAHNDGGTVPLVYNHEHNDILAVLGHAVLENRPEGVYTYGYFNDTELAHAAKIQVEHGDIVSLSIWANQLMQNGSDVVHGNIREVSLVLAGANPGARIETVLQHGEGLDDEALICFMEPLELVHSEEDKTKETDSKKTDGGDDEDTETLQDIIDTMNEKQKNVLTYLVKEALKAEPDESDKDDDKKKKKDDEGGNDMKHNVWDKETTENATVLSHSDQEQILTMAKSSSIGTLQGALTRYMDDHKGDLQHSTFTDEDTEALFPEYKDVRPGAPEFVQRDQGWVTVVMNKVHKSPISRIRTRQMDIRSEDLRASGYQKGKEKKLAGNAKLLKRTTDPQTIYRKDALNRDDIIDIVDFDVVSYQYEVMKQNLYEEIARAIMIGDGRDDGDEAKIYQEHMRSIWLDDDLYTIHADVDITAAKAELQGSNTSANFGENYIYAEAIIAANLYARESYKGSGTMDMFCAPHLLNQMLLARDLNGRRIYSSKTDLAAALDVEGIYTVEQFANQTRTTSDGKTKKLLAIFVNLDDYHLGATKGGEVAKFNQFDIDFNQEKYLIETRLSGANTRVYSAIVLEEDVTVDTSSSTSDEAESA